MDVFQFNLEFIFFILESGLTEILFAECTVWLYIVGSNLSHTWSLSKKRLLETLNADQKNMQSSILEELN